MVEATHDQQDGEPEEQKTFIEDPAILDKFKAAALITDEALKKAVSLCVDGADIYTVCQTVDAYIEAEVLKVFQSKKAKKLERGISFPCCISVNHIMGHYSPMVDESSALKNGDVAKITCGSHIDGFGANSAVTIVVGDAKVTGRKADVMLAAHYAMMAAQRTIKKAGTNNEVTAIIAKVCKEFGCEPVEGVLSHKVKQHLIDGNDVIINKETSTTQVEEYQFAPGDVIGLDIYVSSGEGKPKETEFRTTVYKRELEQIYNLKLKSARSFFTEVNKRFPTLPFSLRAFEDQTAAKVGQRECFEHGMILPYYVLADKAGEYVAQFHTTIAVQPRSTAILSGNLPLDVSRFESEHSIKDEGLKTLLASGLWKDEKAKKK